MIMRTFDFSPLYRSAIGFDHLASLLESTQSQSSYPPYDIELLAEDKYRISMAVSGFVEDELNIESKQNTLTITGQKNTDKKTKSYLYQGIASRNFKHQFELADHVKVVSASLESGLLHVDLAKEIPEAMKPRQIPIQNAAKTVLEGNKS
jgi:molecular chaperone IbpA